MTRSGGRSGILVLPRIKLFFRGYVGGCAELVPWNGTTVLPRIRVRLACRPGHPMPGKHETRSRNRGYRQPAH